MRIYDADITGSLTYNSQTITSFGTVDAVSSSVVDLTNASGSFSTRVTSVESSISNLDNTYATDVEVSTAVSGLNAATSSYLKNTTDTLDGDLTVTGTITAQEFHTEFVSASITYESGSHKFGDTYDDVHEFTGSVNVTNSTGGVTGSYTFNGGNFTISGDDADFNLNITSGSSLANLTEFRFQTDGGNMGRLYMHKGTKHMYLGPTYFPTSSLFLQDGTGTVMSITGSSVGIGTSAPETELDILGPTQDQLRLRTAGSEHYRIGRDSSDGLLYFYGSQTGYTGYVFDGVDGERMRIASDGKVTITGDSNSTAHLKFATVSGGSTNSYIGNFAGALYLSTNYYYDGSHTSDTASRPSMEYFMSDDNIYISTMPAGSPGSRTRLLAISGSQGSIGIGTSSNLAGRLTVKGSGTSNSTNALFIENSAGSYLMAVRDDGETVMSGKVGLGTTSPATALHVYNTAPLISMTDSNSVADTGNQFIIRGLGSGGRIQWYDSPSTTMTDIMEFEANGNVGIGTTNAEYKLDVRSSTMAAKFTAGDGGYAAVIFDGDAGATQGVLTTHNGIIYIGGITTAGTGGQGEIRIEPSAGNKLFIDSIGNIGINSTGPVYRLDVVGDARFTEQVKVDQPIVAWSNSGTKHYTHLATFSGYGSAASALIINTNIPGHNQSGNGNMFTFRIVGYAYSNYGLIDMLVGCYAGENNYYSAWWTGTCQTNWIDNVYVYTNSSGKVAFQIGETTDTLAAEIAITDFVQGFGNVNTSYADSWSCQAVTTLPTQTNKVTLGYKVIAPDIYEDVTFHNSVGIGTTGPSEKLHVEGTTSNILVKSTNAGANANIHFQTTARKWGVGPNMALGSSDFEIYDYTAGSNRLVIDSSGNVGINRTSPLYKLHAEGDAGFNSIVLSNSSTSTFGTMSKVYQDYIKRSFVLNHSFTYTGAGTYYFNLAFPNSGGYGYDLRLVTGRSGNYRNFGYIKHSGQLYWEADGDFSHYTGGTFDTMSSADGGMTASVNSAYGANNINDNSQGTLNWSYYIVRYAITFPNSTTGNDGWFRVHLDTFNYGGDTVYFVKD